ncbi:hypothetical protein ACFQZU_23980, partial [Streptomonospora algeriensis]
MNRYRASIPRWGTGLLAAAVLTPSGCTAGAGGEKGGSESAPAHGFTSDHAEQPVEAPEDPQRIVAIGWAGTPLSRFGRLEKRVLEDLWAPGGFSAQPPRAAAGARRGP